MIKLRCIFISLLLFILPLQAEPLSLPTYIQQVWQSNQDLQAMRTQVKQIEAGIRLKSGLYDTGIGASLTKTKTSTGAGVNARMDVSQKIETGADISVSLTNSKTDLGPAPYASSLELGISQPLTGVGATNFPIEQARLDWEKSQQDFIKKSSDYLLNAIGQYLDYELSFKNLTNAKKNVELAQFVYQENQKKEKLKLVTSYDVLEARINYNKAQDDQLSSQNDLRKNARLLATMMDLATENLFDLQDTGTPSFNPVFIFSEVKNNPQLKAAELAMEKATRALRYDQSQKAPATFLDATLGYTNNGDAYLKSMELNKQSYSVGVRMQYFLNDRAHIAASDMDQYALDQQQLTYQTLQQSLVIQCSNLINDLTILYQRLTTALETISLSETFLQMEQKKFSLGLITTDKIIQDQAGLNQSRLNYSQLRRDYLKNYYILQANTGKLLASLDLK